MMLIYYFIWKRNAMGKVFGECYHIQQQACMMKKQDMMLFTEMVLFMPDWYLY